MKRSDFSHIVEAKGKRGYILGIDDERFFRLGESEENIDEHRDFQLFTPDISVTLEDNVLLVPKNGEPFLDIGSFDDDHTHVTIPMPPEVSARYRDPKNLRVKVKCYLRGDFYSALEAKAKEQGMEPNDLAKKILEEALQG